MSHGHVSALYNVLAALGLSQGARLYLGGETLVGTGAGERPDV